MDPIGDIWTDNDVPDSILRLSDCSTLLKLALIQVEHGNESVNKTDKCKEWSHDVFIQHIIRT